MPEGFTESVVDVVGDDGVTDAVVAEQLFPVLI